jgi:hypothetical protein
MNRRLSIGFTRDPIGKETYTGVVDYTPIYLPGLLTSRAARLVAVLSRSLCIYEIGG